MSSSSLAARSAVARVAVAERVGRLGALPSFHGLTGGGGVVLVQATSAALSPL